MSESTSGRTVTKSVQSLIQQGICRPSDIRRAITDAERLSSPENSGKIRRIERQLKMVGDSNRIKILSLLSKHEMCVCQLESALKLPQPTISHHLGLLEHAGLLERQKKGKFVFYTLVDSPVSKLLEEMLP